jgi:diketogulonate reductase-like aldo/keto reductase
LIIPEKLYMGYKRLKGDVKIPSLGLGTYRMGERRAAGISTDD